MKFLKYNLLFSFIYTFLLSFSIGFTYTQFLDYLWTILLFISSLPAFIIILAIILFLRLYVFKKPKTNTLSAHRFITEFAEYVLLLYGIRISFINKELLPKDKNFVIVSNHEHNLDSFIIKVLFKDYPLSFICKDTPFKYPVLSAILKYLGVVPMDRTSDRSSLKGILAGIEKLKEGQPVAIYPEGHRSKKREMNEFKAGAFKLAMKPKASILVLRIKDTYKFKEKKFLAIKRCSVEVLALLQPEFYENMDSIELSNYTQNLIKKDL